MHPRRQLGMISRPVSGLSGASLGDLGDFDWSAIAGYADIVAGILADPALPEVMGLVKEAASIPSSGGGGAGGIDVSAAIFPLKAYIFYKRNPWFPYVAVPLAFLLPFLGGVLVGRAIAK